MWRSGKLNFTYHGKLWHCSTQGAAVHKILFYPLCIAARVLQPKQPYIVSHVLQLVYRGCRSTRETLFLPCVLLCLVYCGSRSFSPFIRSRLFITFLLQQNQFKKSFGLQTSLSCCASQIRRCFFRNNKKSEIKKQKKNIQNIAVERWNTKNGELFCLQIFFTYQLT